MALHIPTRASSSPSGILSAQHAEALRWALALAAAFYAYCLGVNTLGLTTIGALLLASLVGGAGAHYAWTDGTTGYAACLFVVAATAVVTWAKHGPAGLAVMALAAATAAAVAYGTLAGLDFARQTRGVR